MSRPEIIVGIGGAAGDGVASAGNTLVLSLARQGLAAYSYNSYQSVIRGGHSWLRLRFSAKKPLSQGDQVIAAVALNQDTLDRHMQELPAGGVVLYNGAKLTPSYEPPPGVQLCPLPVPELAPDSKRLPVMQNTVAVGALMHLMGLELGGLESVLESTFAKKPAVVKTNIEAAQAGHAYAAANFKPLATQLKPTDQKWAQASGNHLLAMGAAFGGLQVLLGVPDESGDARSGMVRYPRAASGHLYTPSRRRDLGHQHGHCCRPHGRPQHVRDLGWRIRADDRGNRDGQHHRGTGGGDQRHAGRAIHRGSDQDRAGGSQPGVGGKPGRFPAGDHRSDQHVRLLYHARAGVQRG